ncbi:MAG: hypothetical protein NTU73_10460 [Ignavibacteriae bacterium]|nr:hypothetical protein [Ignavibacteriota bacterium]
MENSDPIKKQIELNSLIEFSQLINSNLDHDFIFGNILLSIMGKMMITKGMFLVKNHSKGENIFIISTVKGLSQNHIIKIKKSNMHSQDYQFSIQRILKIKIIFS